MSCVKQHWVGKQVLFHSPAPRLLPYKDGLVDRCLCRRCEWGHISLEIVRVVWREDGGSVATLLMACLQEFFLESSLCHLRMEEGPCPWLRHLGSDDEENSH